MTRIVLFNKPYGVLSQFRDQAGRSTLGAFIHSPDLRLAGRLDQDSEGLLVLTDDGGLVHRITDPGHNMTKTYWVQVEGDPEDARLQPLREGIMLRDGTCRPARVSRDEPPAWLWPRNPPVRFRRTVPDCWLRITLAEGRNRQVRRMCAAVGLPALRLIRYRVGSWTLDGIAPGTLLELNG